MCVVLRPTVLVKSPLFYGCPLCQFSLLLGTLSALQCYSSPDMFSQPVPSIICYPLRVFCSFFLPSVFVPLHAMDWKPQSWLLCPGAITLDYKAASAITAFGSMDQCPYSWSDYSHLDYTGKLSSPLGTFLSHDLNTSLPPPHKVIR